MMNDQERNEQNQVEEELQDLRKELEHFEKEKERVRAIVGKIGGSPKTQVKLVNALFIIILGNVFNLLGVSPFIAMVIKGLVLVAVIGLDVLRSR